VKHVSDRGVIGCIVLDFEPGALIRGRAENSEIPVLQFQKRESTDIQESQGLFILAKVGQPKLTVGTIVILKVFKGLMLSIRVYIHLVIYSLARIFDVHAKVRDVVIQIILTVFNYIEALNWTSEGYPS